MPRLNASTKRLNRLRIDQHPLSINPQPRSTPSAAAFFAACPPRTRQVHTALRHAERRIRSSESRTPDHRSSTQDPATSEHNSSSSASRSIPLRCYAAAKRPRGNTPLRLPSQKRRRPSTAHRHGTPSKCRSDDQRRTQRRDELGSGRSRWTSGARPVGPLPADAAASRIVILSGSAWSLR